MREIKFRAWNTKTNKFEGGFSIDPILGYASIDHVIQPHLTLMQYTGLKDKNGKEIYEGDIVNYKTVDGFSCEKEDWRMQGKEVNKPKVVYFEDGEFWPREYYDYCDDGYYSTRWFDFEIIGNIYENPELLK